MKRPLFIILALVLAMGLTLPMATPARADPGPLEYDPERYPAADRAEVEQGSSISFPLTIEADAGTDVVYEPKLTALGRGINESWISFSPATLTLSAGQSKSTTVTIDVPKGVDLGDYGITVKFDKTSQPASSQGSGCDVYITVTAAQYTLTVIIVGNGTVTQNPDQATYTYGTDVELTATADPGWTFAGWSGDLISGTNPDTITMNNDKTVTATFIESTQDIYTLTVNTVGSGTVTQNPLPPYYVGDNTVVTLTANPAAGWSFSGWSGDLISGTNPDTITMNGDKTVMATFTRDEYTLTVNTVGSGSVSKNPLPPYYVGENTVVTLTASADPGWTFAGWSGDLGGSTNPDTITMNGNKTVTATFTEIATGEIELYAVQYWWGDPSPGYDLSCWPIFKAWLNVRIENRSKEDVFNVSAVVTDWPANVTVPDPTVFVGDIPAGQSAWSTSPDATFTTCTDMCHLQDPCEGIYWLIEYYDASGVPHVIKNVPEFPPAEGPCD